MRGTIPIWMTWALQKALGELEVNGAVKIGHTYPVPQYEAKANSASVDSRHDSIRVNIGSGK